MRSFASDNNSGVHPLVMEALNRVTVTMLSVMGMTLGQKRLSVK